MEIGDRSYCRYRDPMKFPNVKIQSSRTFVKALSDDTSDKTLNESCEDYVHVRIATDGKTDFLKGCGL